MAVVDEPAELTAVVREVRDGGAALAVQAARANANTAVNTAASAGTRQRSGRTVSFATTANEATTWSRWPRRGQAPSASPELSELPELLDLLDRVLGAVGDRQAGLLLQF